MSGIAKIYSECEGKKFSKYAYAGDYFGETAIVNNSKRAASVNAYTNVKILVLQKHDFNWVFGLTALDLLSSKDSTVSKLYNISTLRLSTRSEFINL